MAFVLRPWERSRVRRRWETLGTEPLRLKAFPSHWFYLCFEITQGSPWRAYRTVDVLRISGRVGAGSLLWQAWCECMG